MTGPGPINLSRRGLSLMYGGQTLKGYKSSTLREQLPSVEIKMRLYLNYCPRLRTSGFINTPTIFGFEASKVSQGVIGCSLSKQRDTCGNNGVNW